MQTKFLLLCLLACNFSFAQYKRDPTIFDSFILKPTIEWAAYADTYFELEKLNFNKLLFSRFLKNDIKVTFPLDFYMNFVSKDSLNDNILYLLHDYNPIYYSFPLYDSIGNPIYPSTDQKPYDIDTSALTSTHITQIFYIEDGTLKSYVPMVTPVIIKVTTADSNLFVGYKDYFSSCHNLKYNYQPKNKDLYLGETTWELRTDTTDWKYFPIKQLYSKGLWETLAPYVWNHKLDVYTIKTEIKLKPEEIYDSVLSRISLTSENVDQCPGSYNNLEDFKELRIVQDWYYNNAENIVFNEIKTLYLCAKECTNGRSNKEVSPVLKIVFR